MKKLFSVILSLSLAVSLMLSTSAASAASSAPREFELSDAIIVNVDSGKIESLKPGEEMLLFEDTFPTSSYSVGTYRATVTAYAKVSATYSTTKGVTMKTKVYSNNPLYLEFLNLSGSHVLSDYNNSIGYYDYEVSSPGAISLTATNVAKRKLTSGEQYWVSTNGEHYTNQGWTSFRRTYMFTA